MERLDEERIDVLRRWGEGLAGEGREELRAAGRAILLLIEEIEHLHVDLWNERSLRSHAAPAEQDAPALAADLRSSLRARLAQFGRRRREEAEQPDAAPPGATPG